MGVKSNRQLHAAHRCLRLLALLAPLAATLAGGVAIAAPLGGFGGIVAEVDRNTLMPSGPVREVLEPHAPAMYAPDRSHFAMGLSMNGGAKRIGLWIVRAGSLEVRHAVRTGIATEDVAFPGVVAGLLQNGDLVVVDPDSGRIGQRHRFRSTQECGSRRPVQQDGRAVFPILRPGERVKLAIVSAKGKVRVIPLSRLRYRATREDCGEVGLVGDGDGHVYVVAGQGDVARVEMRTNAVRYLPGKVWRGCPSGRTCIPRFRAAWVKGSGLAVAGEHVVKGTNRRESPAIGLFMQSARTGEGRLVDASAKTVNVSNGTIVVTGRGVRGYTAAGRRRFSIPTGEALWPPQVADQRLYLPEADQVRIIDLRTGTIVGAAAGWASAGWVVGKR